MPFLSGFVQSSTGPPSRETSSRPLASNVRLTSEKLLSSAGRFTASSTLKPDGTVKRSSPLPASQVWFFHGPVRPYGPSTLTDDQPSSLKPSFCQPSAAVLLLFQRLSLTTARRSWPLGTNASRTISPAGPSVFLASTAITFSPCRSSLVTSKR